MITAEEYYKVILDQKIPAEGLELPDIFDSFLRSVRLAESTTVWDIKSERNISLVKLCAFK